MSLSYPEIAAICLEIKPLIEGGELLAFEELAPKTLLMLINNKGEHLRILLCFDVPCIRVHLSRRKGATPKQPFIHAISKLLTGSTLDHAELLKEDRIVEFSCRKEGKTFHLVAELFSRSPNCYLLDEQKRILHSLVPTGWETYKQPQKPPFPFPTHLEEEISSALIEERYNLKENELLFSREKNRVASTIKNKIKGSKKYLERLREQCENAKTWEEIYHTALLLQSNLYKAKKGMHEIEVDNWKTGTTEKIPLDPAMSPADSVDTLFKKSKKLKESIPHLQERIAQMETTLASLQNAVDSIDKTTALQELQQLCQQKNIGRKKQHPPHKKSVKEEKPPYREFVSKSGLKIWVGRDSKANEKLTFHHAKGNDWWLHVQDWSGSHVIIRTKKGEDPDEETVLDACQLALFYSKAKERKEAEVIGTQKKFIHHARRGTLGHVHIAKHKCRLVRLDPDRCKAIRERKATLPP